MPATGPGAFSTIVRGRGCGWFEEDQSLSEGGGPLCSNAESITSQPWLLRTSTLQPPRSSETCRVLGRDGAWCRGRKHPWHPLVSPFSLPASSSLRGFPGPHEEPEQTHSEYWIQRQLRRKGARMSDTGPPRNAVCLPRPLQIPPWLPALLGRKGRWLGDV